MKRRVIFSVDRRSYSRVWSTSERGASRGEYRRAGGNPHRRGRADGGDVPGEDQGHTHERQPGVRVDGGRGQPAVRGQPPGRVRRPGVRNRRERPAAHPGAGAGASRRTPRCNWWCRRRGRGSARRAARTGDRDGRRARRSPLRRLLMAMLKGERLPGVELLEHRPGAGDIG